MNITTLEEIDNVRAKFGSESADELRRAASVRVWGARRYQWLLTVADRLDELGYPNLNAVPISLLPLAVS